MFSAEYFSEIKAAFDRQMALLEDRIQAAGQQEAGLAPGMGKEFLLGKKEEILGILGQCGQDQAQALTFLYSAMPFSDLLDYPASLFKAYAEHGVYLWHEGDFAGRVPEKIFANYVLHYRVNNEDIADVRKFFHDRVLEAAGRQKGTMYETAVEVNYWCAREATYRASDGRTQGPLTLFYNVLGRCGEESTFGVTALRSIGIPARQIYAPLWTHCDDNHAWVEAWCDGEWHFLGACEPDERLDTGWFIEPASRAMLLHSRWFGKDRPEDAQVGPKGMAVVLNHLDRYADTTKLWVKAVDEDGRPVPGAVLDFKVANHGELGSVALIHTGEEGEQCGQAELMTGYGDLYLCAGKGDLYGENLVSLAGVGQEEEGAVCTVVLKKQPQCWEGWRQLDFHAPKTCYIHDGLLTPKQQETGARRLAQAAEYRQKKIENFYDAQTAEKALKRFSGQDRERMEAILNKARSNMGEIVKFLEWDPGDLLPVEWRAEKKDLWKLQALEVLREKDCWDTPVEVLLDCCRSALPYAGKVPEKVFFRYLLCPRVSNEMLRPCREALGSCLDQGTREAVERDPACLPALVDRWVVSLPEEEYENLITSWEGCLKGGVGSRHSKEVLCVNLYRSLGIPARLSGLDGRVEYYREGRFTAPGDAGEVPCSLTLREDGTLKLSDWEHYSLDRFEEDGFYRLGLWGETDRIENGELTLALRPGIYRILTVNREKNGDQLANMAVFALKEGEQKTMTISLREVAVEGLLSKVETEDFDLRDMDGKSHRISALTGEKALFLWLEVTREPTEHILNELFERKEDFAALKAPIYMVLKSPEDLENPTLHRTLEALPAIHCCLDDFGDNYRALAEKVGRKPGKLPLAVVLENGNQCVYSDAGYNVGLADILWRILQ